MDEMDEIVGEFLVESYENLDQLDRDLIALEQDPNSRDILASVFRTIHTIKGTCGFLGFEKLELVTHKGESLLSKLRDGVLSLTPARTSALLAMVDAVREMLNSIETTQGEGDGNYDALMATLVALQTENSATDASIATAAPTVASDDPAKSDDQQLLDALDEAASADIGVAQGSDTQAIQEAPQTQLAVESASAASDASSTTTNSSVADSSIRVDVGQLDKLMNLVGELVLARNQVLQLTSNIDDSAFAGTTQRLNTITSELQEGVMKTRMQQIGHVWSKFPRVVRDLSLQLGKNIRVEMEGKDTELDKTILEAIKDPLTHIVRNTVDHGIETPAKRVEAGKPAEGVLTLRAFHESGQVVIEIADDGAGLNIERIKSKAVERSLITAEHAVRITDREAAMLIFLPGFSTAETITNVSGRGVGMDVVKTNIEKIGGSVDVTSESGLGATFKIKIPLTLAIIPALTVSSESQRFAIPQVSLLELVRIDNTQPGKTIEMIHGTPVFRLRGTLLPVLELSEQLKIQPAGALALGTDPTRSETTVVVLQADDRQFGLVVDGVHDTEEIVVKPLGKQFNDARAFSGATIMGDGSVVLILDVMGIAQHASVLGEIGDRHSDSGQSSDTGDVEIQASEPLLIVGVGQGGRIAIRLGEVDRLEQFTIDKIEFSEGKKVVQYRNDVMALTPLGELIGAMPSFEESVNVNVVVVSEGGRSIGLVVDQILDIVNDSIVVHHKSGRHGIIGGCVIQGKVTDLLDINAVIGSFDPLFLAAASQPSGVLS
jgi:two-component system chemotaxis sensor kinase CheA